MASVPLMHTINQQAKSAEVAEWGPDAEWTAGKLPLPRGNGKREGREASQRGTEDR